MNQQPSIGQWLPIAAMIGVLAGSSVLLTSWLSGMPSMGWFGAVWALFISWGAWFSIGAKMKRLPKFLVGLVGGVFFGWLTLVLMGVISSVVGGTFGLPLTVFFVATTIVLLELTDLFELAFVYFFAYASFFAYVFGNFDKQDGMSAAMAWGVQSFHFIILLFLGVVYAIVTVWLKNMIFDVERVPLERRNTVFDKE